MPAPDIPENLTAAFYTIGALVAAAVLGFAKIYSDSRGRERQREENSPTIATQAVAAGLVDKSAADAIAGLAEDVHELREIGERYEERVRDEERLELTELRRLMRKKPPDG